MIWFCKVLLLFEFTDNGHKCHQLAFIQDYNGSQAPFVDENFYDTRFSLPKIVPTENFKVIHVSNIVCPVRLIPDFQLLKNGEEEYFVRYQMESSTLVDSLLE